MTDYFANAAYGVMLDDQEMAGLKEEFENSLSPEDWSEHEEESAQEQHDSFATWLEKTGKLGELRLRFDAPPQATVIWTGDEDDRPGRCSTPANSFILGLGMMHFPSCEEMSVTFELESQWHTWVEAG